METFFQDIRYGLRGLRKSPGFTAVAVITLALGIGANTAIFSVVNAVLLRPLPYRNPGTLALLWQTDTNSGTSRDQLSYTDIEEYRNQGHAFQSIVAFGDWNGVFSDPGTPERIPGMQVGDGYFSLMGVEPLLGRAFLPEEQIDGKDQVIILGYGFWQRRFAADPGVVGKQITLSGRPYTVVGVMPKAFPFLPSTLVDGPAQFYRPVAEKYDRKEARSRHLRAIARLKPGFSLQTAQAELNVINRGLAKQYPEDYATTGIRTVSLQQDITGNLRPALLVLLGAVGFLLLIACANIANLLLARSAGRQREVALRAALGANRIRLVRQVLTENLLLAAAGGACALLIAASATNLISALGARVIPQLVSVGMDLRVLAFTATITLLTGLVFGLVPALQLSALSVNDVLKEGGKGSLGANHDKWRTVIGVVKDVKQAGLDAPHTMQIYVPDAQNRTGSLILVVRTSSTPLTYAAAVRHQISAMDGTLAVSGIASMDQVLSSSIAAPRFSTVMLGLFGGLGLLLASVGIYGILSYTVAQRTSEIGIRMALGAAQWDVLSLVVGQGLRLAAIGIAAGVVGALFLTRLMSGLLFEVRPSDPITLLAVVGLLGVVASLASYIPARRASKVDPMVALRYE